MSNGLRRVTFRDYDSKKKEWVEGEGWFHQWANNYQEYDAGPGNYTEAIVEDDNGKIWTPLPANVTFLLPHSEQLKKINDEQQKKRLPCT